MLENAHHKPERKETMRTSLIPAKKVREDLGGISDMTLYRWLNDPALGFPQPIYIKTRRYFDAAQLADFKEKLAGASLGVTKTQ